MKFLKLFLLFIFITFLVGCTKTEYIYKYPDIPSPIEKPDFIDYNVSLMEINDTEYYVLTPEDAKKMGENWIRYKAYAESNFLLLQEIRKGKYDKRIE